MIKAWVLKIWLFILIALWIVSLVMFSVAGEMALINNAILGSAIGLTLLFGLVFRKRIVKFVKKPRTQKTAASSVRIFLIFCILAMVNYLAVKTSRSFDLTQSRLHTLSDQSIKIAESVDKKAKVTLFAKREEWERYLVLLRQYRNVNKNIEIKAVDIDAEPALVRAAGIEKSGTLLIQIGSKKVKGSATAELDITNLFIKAMRSKSLKVYYTVGHGELERHEQSAGGASHLFSLLNDGNYQVAPLDTLKVKEVPADADSVLILGPKKGFMDLEAELIKDYLDRGGNVFALMGPVFDKADLSNLRKIFAERGIRQHNALTLDRLSAVQGANATIPIVNRYNHEHSITKNFSGRTLFPLSSALENAQVKNARYTGLAMSSPFPASWAESQLTGINSGKVFYTKGVDLKGPVDLLAVSENLKDFGKLAVGASVEFVSNAYQNQSSNFNLFLNTLAWLMDDEGIISLNRPQASSNMILLSAPQISLIFYFSILFLPFTLFGAGIWMYRKRLNK